MDLERYLTRGEFHSLRLVKRGLPISRAMARRLSLSGYVANIQPLRFRLASAEITILGMRYISYRKELIRSQFFTRVLAVLALIISLISLLADLIDHGYIRWPL